MNVCAANSLLPRPLISYGCTGRNLAGFYGGAERRMVPFGLVGVVLGEVGDRAVEALVPR